MTSLRDRYVAALIAHVESGNLDDGFLDRIERMLGDEVVSYGRFDIVVNRPAIEPQAPEILPPEDVATPASAQHEGPQEREEVAERPARPATAEQPVAPPAPSPDRKRRGRPAAPMPKCQDCGRELTNRQAQRCRACSNKARKGTKSPATSATMTQVWEERRAADPLCIDGCGKRVSKVGGRCRTCADVLRQKPLSKAAPEPLVTAHVSPDATPETLEAIAAVAQKAIEAIANGDLPLTDEQKLENLLACSCSADAIEDAGTAWKPEQAGPWHSISCSLRRGPDQAPPVETTNRPATPGVCHCGQPLVYYREIEGDEWRCFNGHVSYGVGFEPIAELAEGRTRRREPSHSGSRL